MVSFTSVFFMLKWQPKHDLTQYSNFVLWFSCVQKKKDDWNNVYYRPSVCQTLLLLCHARYKINLLLYALEFNVFIIWYLYLLLNLITLKVCRRSAPQAQANMLFLLYILFKKKKETGWHEPKFIVFEFNPTANLQNILKQTFMRVLQKLILLWFDSEPKTHS